MPADGPSPQREPQAEPWNGRTPALETGSQASDVDATARHLLVAFFERNDPRVFQQVVDLLAPRLMPVARDAVLAQGLLTDPADVVSDWFSAVFIDVRPRIVVPMQVQAAATRWLLDRTERLVGEIAAQPLPGEHGYHAGMARALVANLSPESSDKSSDRETEYMYTFNVAFHRLTRLERQVLRATDLDFTLPVDLGAQLGLSEADVLAVLSDARMRLEHMCHEAIGDLDDPEDEAHG